MTVVLDGCGVAARVEEKLPGSIIESNGDSFIVKNEYLAEAAAFLKDTPDLDFAYFNYVTAVDYFQYFEVTYQLTSLEHNHSVVFKVRCYDRENPILPSLINLWQGADYQEREIYDLFGIRFDGHPNLKRIFLWEGFQGHPLRKDYL